MRILHYFLGFPPYRSGGMTKFALDLAKSQVRDGNEVLALWPGRIKDYSSQPQIIERKKIEGIRSFELINPLPVSLDEGISEFDFFTRPCDINVYLNFLKKYHPDVIHVHTLMGMHKEFILAASETSIRTIMTTHDYFGLCPKVTLYRFGVCCDNDCGCKKCIQCNQSSLSLKKIQLMQSPMYRWLKNTPLIKKLRERHRNNFFEEKEPVISKNPNENDIAKQYIALRRYYVDILESIDFIHFNSTIAESVYRRYIVPKDSRVVSITHQGIELHERNKVQSAKKVILFLAPAKPFKGWNILKKACDQLWEEHVNFELRVFSPVSHKAPYMVVKENGFVHSELERMMNEADLLVAPSVWYETFGFTVLEALSYGVPVVVSDHVGAKDVIGMQGSVVPFNNASALHDEILKILQCNNINRSRLIKLWPNFTNEMLRIYANQWGVG